MNLKIKIIEIIEFLTKKIEIPITPINKNVYYPSDDSFLFIDYLGSNDFFQDITQLFQTQYFYFKEIENIRSDNYELYFNILDMGCGVGILGFFVTIVSAIYLITYLNEKEIINKISSALVNFNIDFVDINPFAIASAKLLLEKNNEFFSEKFVFNILKIENKNLNEIFKIKLKFNPNYYISNLFSNFNPRKYNIMIFNPPYLPSEPELIGKNNEKLIDFAWNGGDESGLRILKDFLTQMPSSLDNNSLIYFIISSNSKTEDLFNIFKNKRYYPQLVKKIHIFFEDILLYKIII